MSKQITVTWGQETFNPIPYNSFTVGPFTMSVEIKDGETVKQAMSRTLAQLDKFADSEFIKKRNAFFERFKHKGYE